MYNDKFHGYVMMKDGHFAPSHKADVKWDRFNLENNQVLIDDYYDPEKRVLRRRTMAKYQTKVKPPPVFEKKSTALERLKEKSNLYKYEPRADMPFWFDFEQDKFKEILD